MKTHRTAIVLIPPTEIWEPIQEVRRRHDRQLRRWMPHVTLVYPFRPQEELASLEAPFREALRAVSPFEVELRDFRSFRHGPRSFTVWLAPEPAEALVRLEATLRSVVPDCNDQAHHEGGFHPHLSVGQVRGSAEELAAFLAELEGGWTPLRFTAGEVSLIARGEPPDDVFRVENRIPLG